MPPHTYRTAIVGTGAIAGAHAEAVRACGGRARLVATADPDADRARAFAARWDIPGTYPSLAELLRAQEVDLVCLCTPPAQHAPLAVMCLEAGVTALVEKPPTLSLAELDTLTVAERRSPAHVATVFQHRFGPAAVRLRELVAAGTLGRPLLATCTTQWYRDQAYFAAPWRGTWALEGGGPTMSHGIHQFDLLLSVLGPWQEVSAVAARQARTTDTEDVSMALVRFANGTLATVVNSVVSPRQTSHLRFDFEHATIEVAHLYGYTGDDWTLTPAPGHEQVLTSWNPDPADAPSSHTDQFGQVLDALDAGQAPPVTSHDTRVTMEFVAAVYASAFTGERVRAGEIGPDSPFWTRMDGTGAPWAKVSTR